MPDEVVKLTASVESFSADGNTIEVRIVPYGPTITHNGVAQRYTRVDVDDGMVVPFTAEHETRILDRGGMLVSHEQRDDGLYGTIRTVDTTTGRDLQTLAREGLLTDVSAEVLVTSQYADSDGALVRTGLLRHIAGTLAGAFGDSEPGSKVLAAYTHDEGETIVEHTTETTTEVVELTETPTPNEVVVDLTAIEDELREVRQLVELQGRNDTPRELPTAVEWFTAQLHDQLGDQSRMRKLKEQYAISEITGTTGGSSDASGLMPTDWWHAGLVDVRGGWRPLFDRLGSMPYPSSGTTVTWPVVSSGPDVDERTAQNAEAASAALVVATDTASIKWFDGALRVPIELIEQSDPAVMSIIYGRMHAMAQAKIENYACDTIAKGGTAEGAVLTLSSYSALVTDLIATSELIRAATDYPGNMLACSTDDWKAILALVDGNDRRLFSTQGSAAADGSAGILAQELDIAGVTAFHASDLAESMQYNKVAAKGTDKGPRRVQQLQVADMGYDVGILASAVVAPVIQGGIYYYAAAVPT